MRPLTSVGKAAVIVEVLVAFAMPAFLLLYGALIGGMALFVGVREPPADTVALLLCVPLGIGGMYAVGSLLWYVTVGSRPRLRAQSIWALLGGGLFALAYSILELGFVENGAVLTLVVFPGVVALHLTALASDHMWTGDA